jgi:serine phosphatase RsbU (regulator of sigma subunit)
MLGVRVGTDRADHEIDLQPGDVLVLYTDGLVEERRVPLDARLEALRQAVQELSGISVEQVADALVQQLPCGDDDVAVLVLHVQP